MEVGSNIQTEKEISLKKAAVILVVVIGVVITLGLIVGYKFFWNQFDSKSAADLRIQAVEKTVKSFPNNPMAHANLGLEYLRRGKNDEAIKELEKANKLDKKSIGIRFSLGLAYSEAKKYDKAQPIYEGIIKENPYHFLAQVNLGVLYQKKKNTINLWSALTGL